jgi:hypothetical protein
VSSDIDTLGYSIKFYIGERCFLNADIDTLGYSIKFYIGERCFLNGSVLKQENEELIDIQQVLSQNIWLTPFIKIGDNVYDQNML